MRDLLRDLKEFLMRGNVVDLAVAVVIGIAFGAVVQSFVNDVLMQIIAAIGGQPNFSSLKIGVGDGVIRYGAFLNTIVSFVIIGTALFFFVKAFEILQRKKREPKATEVELLADIRDLLRDRA